MKSREILAYLSVKHNGDWNKIYQDLMNKKYGSEEEMKEILSTIKCNYITLIDKEYPNYLKQVFKPPFVLFYYGDISLIKDKNQNLLICGGRDIDINNTKALEQIIPNMADKNLITTLSLGTGEIVLRQAIREKRKAVCVMMSGIDNCYPNSLKNIYDHFKLSRNGLVISEYPNNVQPSNESGMMRARYISNLSQEMIVSQINKHSGSVVIVNNALQYGNTVNVIPQPFNSDYYNNTLIYEGAIPVVLGCNC